MKTQSSMMMGLLFSGCLSLLIVGCGGDLEPESSRRGSTQASGKADTSGSCVGFCGQQSADGCWCDDLCMDKGDCCQDKLTVCGAGSLNCEQAGGQCAALTANGVLCPEGFISEGDAGTCAVGAGCCMPMQCPLTGVACVPDCPDSGKLEGGASCIKGTFNLETCQCEQAATPTCEDAGGQCAALTANGVSCPTGFEPNGAAGTCAVGAGCCMPAQCPLTGVACVPDCPADGKLAGGAPCIKGNFDQASCTCVPIQELTCEQAGGQCAPLTANGIQCPAGHQPAGDAGSCGIGGGCCLPMQQTCEGFCGEKAPLGCWCDEQCAQYGDCCPDKSDHC